MGTPVGYRKQSGEVVTGVWHCEALEVLERPRRRLLEAGLPRYPWMNCPVCLAEDCSNNETMCVCDSLLGLCDA